MTPLEQAIRARIRRSGKLPVADYMALALGDPHHGYYAKADPIGARGDFITAPEISQAFGEIIGLWCAVTWQRAGGPDPVMLVELGPGRGTLMADALRAARAVPGFAAALRLHLVESSETLRNRQRTLLAQYSPQWHASFATVPAGPALVIANEFFDALPIEQYVRTASGWRRRCIAIDAATDGLAFIVDDGTPPPDGIIPPDAADAAPGQVFEHSAAGTALARALGRRMASDGIATLVVDYGHARSAAGETLQAVRRHRRHDVLRDAGEADLTAHVDFAALARAASSQGAACWGPVPQGVFLSRLGVRERTEALAARTSPDRAELLRSGCRRLIDAGAMGEAFKVLALTRQASESPAGFEPPAPEPLRRGA